MFSIALSKVSFFYNWYWSIDFFLAQNFISDDVSLCGPFGRLKVCLFCSLICMYLVSNELSNFNLTSHNLSRTEEKSFFIFFSISECFFFFEFFILGVGCVATKSQWHVNRKFHNKKPNRIQFNFDCPFMHSNITLFLSCSSFQMVDSEQLTYLGRIYSFFSCKSPFLNVRFL